MGSMILVLNEREAGWALESGMVEGRDFVRQIRMEPIAALVPIKPRAREHKKRAPRASYRARLNTRRKDKHFEADVRKWAATLTPAQAQRAIDEFRKLEPKR